VPLLGFAHLALIAAIAILAWAGAFACRRGIVPARPLRWALGWALAVNELIWWVFRYSQEGLRFPVNLPLQLCDLTVWVTVIACLTLAPWAVEFAYFAGIWAALFSILTPDLWTPWPSYPAIYFFIVHGGILIASVVLVFGRIVRLRPGAPWRAFGILLAYACVIGLFNAVFGSNYVYLCRKPVNPSFLDLMGPWPVYLVIAGAVTLALFWLLWLPLRRLSSIPARYPPR